jgi:hypothetical protein
MYLYNAHAVALGGTVERPVQQNIGAVASCALPVSGGTSSVSEGKFDNGLVAFDSAQCHITGSEESRRGKTIYVTGISAAVYGLNIRNMVMADQVALRIACEHEPPDGPEPWGEPRIITTGSHFDNLKIAGCKVMVDMDHEIFHDYPTHADFQSAWKGNNDSKGKKGNKDNEEKKRIIKRLMGSTLDPPPTKTDPDHLREAYRIFDQQRKAAELAQTVLFSCVEDVRATHGARVGAELDNWKSVIRIPQFGTIYLGEVIVCPGHRRIHMLRLQLGSPDGGGVVIPAGSGNGGNAG